MYSIRPYSLWCTCRSISTLHLGKFFPVGIVSLLSHDQTRWRFVLNNTFDNCQPRVVWFENAYWRSMNIIMLIDEYRDIVHSLSHVSVLVWALSYPLELDYLQIGSKVIDVGADSYSKLISGSVSHFLYWPFSIIRFRTGFFSISFSLHPFWFLRSLASYWS